MGLFNCRPFSFNLSVRQHGHQRWEFKKLILIYIFIGTSKMVKKKNKITKIDKTMPTILVKRKKA